MKHRISVLIASLLIAAVLVMAGCTAEGNSVQNSKEPQLTLEPTAELHLSTKTGHRNESFRLVKS